MAIANCPECGYTLKGLPVQHRCPECGWSYGPDTEVIEGRRSRVGLLFMVRLLLSLAAPIALARAQSLSEAVAVGIAALLLILWWRAWFRARRPYYVVVTATQLHYYEKGRMRLFVDLHHVWSAEYSSLSKEVKLLDREGRCVVAVPDLGGLDYADVAALCAAVNTRAERLRA